MLFGPIFHVEALTSVRRVRFFIVRGLYACILLFCLWSAYMSSWRYQQGEMTIQAVAELAASFFQSFAWLQLLMVLLVGPALVAGTISVERERRTIEYLFATDLANREIVLGKLTARLLQLMLYVLVGLPVLAIFRLLGGISGELLLAVFVLTLSTMVAVSAISICVSVWSPRARDAVVRVYLLMAALLLVPPLNYLLLRGLGLNWPVADWLVEICTRLNPLWVLSSMMWGTGVVGAAIDWLAIATMTAGHAAISAACIVSATLAVRRVHLTSGGRPLTQRRRLWRRRRPGIGRWPMLWKELYARHANVRYGLVGRAAMWLLLAIGGVATAFAFWDALTNRPWATPVRQYINFSSIFGAMAGCFVLLLVAARAAGSVTMEKEGETWTSLVGTPLTAREIVWAKIAGSLYAFRWMGLFLVCIWAPAAWFDPGYLFMLPVQIAIMLMLAVYASALGLLYSLNCRTTLRAIGATFATGIFIGGGFLFCCMPLMIGGGSGTEIVLAPIIPMLLGLPGFVYLEWTHGIGHGPNELVAAFILGTIGYSVAAMTLIAAAIGNFDRLVGRPDAFSVFNQRRPRRPQAHPPEKNVVDDVVMADLAEEDVDLEFTQE